MWGGGVGEVQGVGGGGKGAEEGFVKGAGFGVEEGGGLSVAVEEEDAEGGRGGLGGGGHCVGGSREREELREEGGRGLGLQSVPLGVVDRE